MKKYNRQKFLLVSIVLCLVIASGVYFSFKKNEVQDPQIQSSKFKEAPDFELPDAQGKKHRLKEFSGNLVLLHFWASWCPPCLEEIPQWVEIGAAFQGLPIKLVAVSLDQNWEDAQKILPSQQLKGNVISLLDTSSQVPDAYGSYQFPETYLISPDLKIMTKWVGPQPWGSSEFRGFIEKILKDLKGSPKTVD
jgi:peroxiredoxin